MCSSDLYRPPLSKSLLANLPSRLLTSQMHHLSGGKRLSSVRKEQPADLDKIRPVSLTSKFVVEGFVFSWLLRDIRPAVDTRQFRNLKGISTSHCLIEILDFFYQGAENKQTVSSLVLTDFSKAFDSVPHNSCYKTHTHGCTALTSYIYIYAFSRRIYPKRLPRESFTKSIGH